VPTIPVYITAHGAKELLSNCLTQCWTFLSIQHMHEEMYILCNVFLATGSSNHAVYPWGAALKQL